MFRAQSPESFHMQAPLRRLATVGYVRHPAEQPPAPHAAMPCPTYSRYWRGDTNATPGRNLLGSVFIDLYIASRVIG